MPSHLRSPLQESSTCLWTQKHKQKVVTVTHQSTDRLQGHTWTVAGTWSRRWTQTIPPSLWPSINVLLGGEQRRDGAFLHAQPFGFQAHILPHHCFLIVVLAGKVKAAKSGRGGRPCPVCTMHVHRFRWFAGEWHICGKLYSIIWRTWAPSSYTAIWHGSPRSNWLLQLQFIMYPHSPNQFDLDMSDYCDVTSQDGKFWRRTYQKWIIFWKGAYTTFNMILCSFKCSSTIHQNNANMSVAL